MEKIKLNEEKAEQIVFRRRVNDKTITNFLKKGNTEIIPKTCVKYLGVELDPRLNFHQHIKNFVNKAYSIKEKLYPLLCSKSKLTEKNKILLYIRPLIT